MNHDCTMQKDVKRDKKKVFKSNILYNITFYFYVLNHKFSTLFISELLTLDFWSETSYQNHDKISITLGF